MSITLMYAISCYGKRYHLKKCAFSYIRLFIEEWDMCYACHWEIGMLNYSSWWWHHPASLFSFIFYPNLLLHQALHNGRSTTTKTTWTRTIQWEHHTIANISRWKEKGGNKHVASPVKRALTDEPKGTAFSTRFTIWKVEQTTCYRTCYCHCIEHLDYLLQDMASSRSRVSEWMDTELHTRYWPCWI